MLAVLEYHDAGELNGRVCEAPGARAAILSEGSSQTCRRFPSMGQTEKTARIEHLIGSEAWIDAALALIDLELPQWQVRRIASAEGEWHCRLSRQRALPACVAPSLAAHPACLALTVLKRAP